MGTQQSSKILIKGYTTHYAKLEPIYIQVKLLFEEIQTRLILLPLTVKMGGKLKHLVKMEPCLEMFERGKNGILF